MKNISSAYGKYSRVSRCLRVRVSVYVLVGTVQIYTNPQGGTEIYFTALIVIKFITYNERSKPRAPESRQQQQYARTCAKQWCPSGQQQALRIRTVSPFYLTAIQAAQAFPLPHAPSADSSYLCCFYGPCTILLFYFSMQCLAVIHTHTPRERARQTRAPTYSVSKRHTAWCVWVKGTGKSVQERFKKGLESCAIVWTAFQTPSALLSIFLSPSARHWVTIS